MTPNLLPPRLTQERIRQALGEYYYRERYVDPKEATVYATAIAVACVAAERYNESAQLAGHFLDYGARLGKRCWSVRECANEFDPPEDFVFTMLGLRPLVAVAPVVELWAMPRPRPNVAAQLEVGFAPFAVWVADYFSSAPPSPRKWTWPSEDLKRAVHFACYLLQTERNVPC